MEVCFTNSIYFSKSWYTYLTYTCFAQSLALHFFFHYKVNGNNPEIGKVYLSFVLQQSVDSALWNFLVPGLLLSRFQKKEGPRKQSITFSSECKANILWEMVCKGFSFCSKVNLQCEPVFYVPGVECFSRAPSGAAVAQTGSVSAIPCSQ